MDSKEQAKIYQLAAEKQRFKEIEQTLTYPLTSNPHFQKFKDSCRDPNNRINYLTFGVHRVLRDLFNRSIGNSNTEQLLLIEVINDLSESTKHTYDLAVAGSFLQEAFSVIRTNISLCQIEPLEQGVRDYQGNYKIQKHLKKPFYDESYQLEPINPNNVLALKLWLETAINFMKNPAIMEYSIVSNYLFFDYILAFLTKCEKKNFVMNSSSIRVICFLLTNIEVKEGFKTLFYSLLEVCFSYPKMCQIFLQDAILNYWFLELINGCTTLQDFTRAYQLLGHLAKSDKFNIIVGEINIASSYVYETMVKIVYSTERSLSEKAIYQNPDKVKEISRIAVSMFYNFTTNKSNLKILIKSLMKFHTDILLRFLVNCVLSRDHYCTTYMAFGILNMIKSDKYKFPSFSSRLGVFMVASVVGQDDFLLMLVLRIIKFIVFNKNEKISIFRMLLTSDKSQSIQTTLQPVEELILRKNLDELTKLKKKGTTFNKINHKPKSKKNNQKNRFDDSSDEDSDENDHQNDNLNKDEDDLYRKLMKKSDSNSLAQSKNKDSEFYYKKKNNPNEHFARKMQYPFINDLGQCYNFIKDCDGLCPFCSYAKGLFSMNDDELREHCFKELKKNEYLTLDDPADLSLSIFQAVFDFTLDDSIGFLYHTVVPYYCQFLLADGVPIKYKFPILLYFLHLIINYKKGAQILYGISFFLFAEDFISTFLFAFDLDSLKKRKETKLLKVILPKSKQQRNIPNRTNQYGGQGNKNPQVVDQQGVGSNGDLDQSMIDLDFEEVDVKGIDYLIWSGARNCFTYEDKAVDTNDEEIFAANAEDALTDEGKYSKYFWKLHFMQHCLRVVLEMIRCYSLTSKVLIESQLENFVEQAREIIIILYKYSKKFIPTRPFHEDTECWGEIKNIIFEILGSLLDVLYALVYRFPKFANDFFTMVIILVSPCFLLPKNEKNPELLQVLIKIIGRLPTLSGSIALVSCLSLAYSYETSLVITEHTDQNEQLFIKLFENLTKEFNRLEGGLSAVLNPKQNTTKQTQKKADRVVLNTLQFLINALNVLNHTSIKDRLNSEKIDSKNMETMFKSFTSILKLLKTFLNDHQNSKGMNKKRSFASFDHEVQELDTDMLYPQLFLNAGMFLWTYSFYQSTTTPLLKSGILQFILKHLLEMELSQDIFFAFMALCYNICYYSGDVKTITKYYEKFSFDLNEFLIMANHSQRPGLVPILRGVKVILAKNPQERLIFREYSTILRELMNEGNEDYFDSPREAKFNNGRDDELLNMIADKHLKMNKISAHYNLNYGEIKKEMRKKFKSKDSQQLKLLKKEARDLLKLIGIVNVVDIQEVQNKFHDPRKHVTDGAGLLSNSTARILYEAQKRKEYIEAQGKSDNNILASFNIGLGNSLTKMPRKVLNEDLQRPPEAQNSLNVGLDSFNMSREIAGYAYRPGLQEFNERFKKGDRSNPSLQHGSYGNIRSDAFIDTIEPTGSNNYRPIDKTNNDYQTNKRYPSPNILRDSGRNILRQVDVEYQSILRSNQNPHKKLY